MSFVSLKSVSESMGTTILHVYDYQDKNLKGTITNLYYGREIVFHNLTQWILYMEQLMDELSYPQATMQPRQFRNCKVNKLSKTEIADALEIELKEKPIATFRIRILYRQSASWQGRIQWNETKEEVAFRSMLELIKLIDNALEHLDGSVPLSDVVPEDTETVSN